MRFSRSLCWLRRDIRLHDSSALTAALENSKETAIVFVFDTEILKHLQSSDRRITFIYDSVMEVDELLKKFKSRLIIKYGNPVEIIPKLAEELNVQAVFCNKDYDRYSCSRDQTVYTNLKKSNIDFFTFKDHVIFEEKEILNTSQKAFTVFTPYSKTWLKKLSTPDYAERKVVLENKVISEANLKNQLLPITLEDMKFQRQSLWLKAGTKGAYERLTFFLKNISDYKENRNFLNIDGTSGLSTHLRFGTVSTRELVRLALSNVSTGHQSWLNELIWRDFYHMILSQYPHVSQSTFRPEYQALKWTGKQEHFEAWCEGRTGYPIVDAAMRLLVKTGWMHNRLRMVTASFLTKDLHVDYKLGEKFFAQQLLDYDKAANNGGWQWAASTGCDAQPYFRIFNPYLQSKKFDPDGSFIRENCPELKHFSDSLIHEPQLATSAQQASYRCIIGKDYPIPIVIHSEEKNITLEMFNAIKKENGKENSV